MSNGPAVIDASALLALIFGETLTVARGAFENGILSTVNLSEVVAKMIDVGATAEDAATDIEALGLDLTILPFERETALLAGELRAGTRQLGLSLGERACLATALSRGLPVLTADRAWTRLDAVKVILAR